MRVSLPHERGHLGEVGRPLAGDEEQQSRLAVLILDESGSGGVGIAKWDQLVRRSPVVAGIIGALRAWTVAMISALSIPCR
jgi:hypothetical protein